MSGYAVVASVGWMLLGLGLAALLLWLKGRRPRPGSRRCPACEYDLSATDGLTCPECGRTSAGEDALHGRRRDRRWAVVAALLLTLGAGTLVFDPYRRDGWAASVPNCVLWPLMPLLDPLVDGKAAAARLRSMFSASTRPVGPETHWQRLVRARAAVRALEGAANDLRALPAAPGGAAATPAIGEAEWYLPMSLSWDDDEMHLTLDALLDFAESAGSPARTWALRLLGQWLPLSDEERRRLGVVMKDADELVWLGLFEVQRVTSQRRDTLEPVAAAGLEHAGSEVRRISVLWLYDRGAKVLGRYESKLEAMRSNDPAPAVRAAAEMAIARLRRAHGLVGK